MAARSASSHRSPPAHLLEGLHAHTEARHAQRPVRRQPRRVKSPRVRLQGHLGAGCDAEAAVQRLQDGAQ